MIVPGEMRYKISIVTITVTKDAYGADVTTRTTILTLRAKREQTGGDTSVNREEIFSSEQVTWTTYYRPEILSAEEVVHAGKRYAIKLVTEIGFKAGMKISTELIND